jgi:hypothetical protein
MLAAIPGHPAGNDHDDVVRGDICSRTRERLVIASCRAAGAGAMQARGSGAPPDQRGVTVSLGKRGRAIRELEKQWHARCSSMVRSLRRRVPPESDPKANGREQRTRHHCMFAAGSCWRGLRAQASNASPSFVFVHELSRQKVCYKRACSNIRASAPIPKFARACSTFRCEFRNRRTLATL